MVHVIFVSFPTAREGNVFTVVCLSTGGSSLWRDTPLPLWTETPPPLWTGIPLNRDPSTEIPLPLSTETLLDRDPTDRDPLKKRDPLDLTCSGSHCSGWYAYYWNTFLFKIFLFCSSFRAYHISTPTFRTYITPIT